MNTGSSEPAQAGGDKLCTIGLDVGGTKMAGCVATSDGKIHASGKTLTGAQRGGLAVAVDARELAKNLDYQARQLGLQPQGLGIGICELVNLEGELASECTVAWREPEIIDAFKAFLPTTFEADSRAAALAEARFGGGREFPILLYVTVGTGIGSSLVIDGKPYKGARGATGTMATGDLTTICQQCGTLTKSNLERTASGTALGCRYREVTGDQAATAETALAAANGGDELARQVVGTGAQCLGSMIAQHVNMLDPHAVIIGGGLGSAPGYYWHRLVETIRADIWSDTQRDLPIVQSTLGELACALGAALYAAERNCSGC